ncbi:MAG: disulfide bond formation protein DsbB [Alteromonas sp.]|uniref:disulfide bond formation protein DsbB n=1 Tax=Alteromonas sp. MB-3u-76 TaxID=2058133 RepID=UPI000C313DD8|nr:disulfide bond formation protein DsbB [Alteromonas sp. MB-3u-76]AUC87977.1 disulfide bond formation protein DsbB [Alteromonas sp. MB-3u-76]MAI63378.1 disulfide bond formation protein DsbB [Alteromonas sp.]
MRTVISGISRWAEHKSSWLVLFASSLALEVAALYFQHAMGLKPCIMCIYQRTAMYGIVLAALIVLISNNGFTRMLGFAGWAVSAVWGYLIATEHVEILNASNPFFASCEIVPNFPSWLQLHEWIPAVFAAEGDCLENTWQFLSMGMAEWMQIIFAVYAIAFVIVFACRLLDKKPF